jgi:hypothetical protein
MTAVEMQAQDTIHLKYNFQVGTTLHYQMKVNGDIMIEVAGGQSVPVTKNTAKIEGDFAYVHEIMGRNNADKTVTINITYGKSYMNTIVNDTVIPNPDVPLLDGKTAVVTVAENGDVKSYQLPQGLPVSLQNADFKKMFAEFPDRDLRLGESWINNAETVDDKNDNFIVNSTVSSTYSIVGFEKKGSYECAKVKLDAKTLTTTASKRPDMIINGKVEGKVEGIVFYDLTQGFVVYSNLRTVINNKVENGERLRDEKTGTMKQSSIITTIVDTDMNTVAQLL